MTRKLKIDRAVYEVDDAEQTYWFLKRNLQWQLLSAAENDRNKRSIDGYKRLLRSQKTKIFSYSKSKFTACKNPEKVKTEKLQALLSAGDLRTTADCNFLVSNIKTQKQFDALFRFLFHSSRVVVMHAADAVEKISALQPRFLIKHKKQLLELLPTAENKELKWHLAMIVSRLPLSDAEFKNTWSLLQAWALGESNSRLVRVAALQALYEMTKSQPKYLPLLHQLMKRLDRSDVPSLAARMRHIRSELQQMASV